GSLAGGLRVDGVDVGGLSTAEATKTLQRRSRAALGEPVRFVAAGHAFRLKAADIGFAFDWKATVEAARHRGDGFGPLLGFRRLELRLFGGDVSPKVAYDDVQLKAAVARIARRVARPHREAARVRHGLQLAIGPARAGQV